MQRKVNANNDIIMPVIKILNKENILSLCVILLYYCKYHYNGIKNVKIVSNKRKE